METYYYEAVQVLSKAFDEHKEAFPQVPKRQFGSCSTLLGSSTAFDMDALFDRCLIKLPTGKYVSPQSMGLDLVHVPTTVIALNRTIRDGTSYASSLTPIPEEWLVERDWHIVHHWEDQFCRDIYRDLCRHQEMQHSRAAVVILPGTTPQVCPVPRDNI